MTNTVVTIQGGFHNSSPITLRLTDGKMSVGQYKRLENHMCGIKGCICAPRHGWSVEGMSYEAFMQARRNAADECFK